MTREHRLIMGLDEIKALRWQRKACNAAVSFQLDQTFRFPENCPGCFADTGVSSPHIMAQTMEHFVRALKAVRGIQSQTPGTLTLEFDADAAR